MRSLTEESEFSGRLETVDEAAGFVDFRFPVLRLRPSDDFRERSHERHDRGAAGRTAEKFDFFDLAVL